MVKKIKSESPVVEENRIVSILKALESKNKDLRNDLQWMRGDGVVSDITSTSSGILSLDIALGIGGYPHGRIIEVYGPESAGKAQPLTSKILTPVGWKTLGSIRAGDLVVTPDNKTAPVLGVFPQGVKDIYRVTFSDGSSTECCEEHLWHVKTWDDEIQGIYRLLSLREIMVDYKSYTRLKYSIPLVEPLEFYAEPFAEFDLDPYILGMLLGDGSFRDSTIKFSSGDGEMVEVLNKYADENGMALKGYGKFDYHLVKKVKGKGKAQVKSSIERLGLYMKSSHEKFIPLEYLHSSKDNRISLLQGLMDTDGTVNSGTPGFTSTSQRLALDVVYLVQSLGGRAHIGTKQTHYPHNGRLLSGKPAWNVSFLLPDEVIPFRLRRKVEKLVIRDCDFRTRWLSDITYVGKKEAVCIFVDHPDHLYITDDFIVTHNTTLTLHAIAAAQRAGGVALFIDAEHAHDCSYSAKVGVDVQNLLIDQPDSGEKALEMAVNMSQILTKGDIIVIDSVAALTPQAELNGEVGDAHVGLQARLMGQGLRKLTSSVSKSGVIVYFTNQIRYKIGVMFGNPETTSGGNALKFYASVRLDVRRKAQIKKGEDIIGNLTEVKVVKNKVAPPYKVAETEIRYGQGVPRELDVLLCGMNCGVVEKGGAWLSFHEAPLGQGKDKAWDFLRENPETLSAIEAEVRAHYGI